MMRIPMSKAASALFRAILARGEVARDRIFLTAYRSTDWQSLTLIGERHQLGFSGKETNVLELEAQYVVGSGNHARTFLHRAPDGRLVQLPVSWYQARPLDLALYSPYRLTVRPTGR